MVTFNIISQFLVLYYQFLHLFLSRYDKLCCIYICSVVISTSPGLFLFSISENILLISYLSWHMYISLPYLIFNGSSESCPVQKYVFDYKSFVDALLRNMISTLRNNICSSYIDDLWSLFIPFWCIKNLLFTHNICLLCFPISLNQTILFYCMYFF